MLENGNYAILHSQLHDCHLNGSVLIPSELLPSCCLQTLGKPTICEVEIDLRNHYHRCLKKPLTQCYPTNNPQPEIGRIRQSVAEAKHLRKCQISSRSEASMTRFNRKLQT